MNRQADRRYFRLYCEEEEEHRLADAAEKASLDLVAKVVLEPFGLESEYHHFLASADGLAILANCCNFAAKVWDADFYTYKPVLIQAALHSSGVDAWASDGIVYIETMLGQVSFHALCGEDEGLPQANGRTWSGVEYQFNACLVAQAFIDSWNKVELESRIVARTEASAA